MSKEEGIAMLVTFRIHPEADEAFNAWYDSQHLPQLLAIPGFRSARRLMRCDDSYCYLTIYEVDGEHIFESDAFLEWKASTASSPPGVEWLQAFERVLYKDVGAFEGLVK